MYGSNHNWNLNEVHKLIEMFKERELLWNTSLDDNRNRDKKREAWCEISKALNMDKITVERKARSLVGQFQRELRKHALSGTSKWFAFKKMMFLQNRHSQDTDSETSLRAEPKDFSDGILQDQPVVSQMRRSNISMIRKRMVAKRHQNFLRSKQLYNTLPNVPENTRRALCQEENEFDVFARNVALQLKQLPLIHALESQELIQRILKEQRIKALRERPEKQRNVTYHVGRGDSNDDSYSVSFDPLSSSCSVPEPGPSEITKSEPDDW